MDLERTRDIAEVFLTAYHKEAVFYSLFLLTLFVINSIEHAKSWETECLRTPLGGWAKGEDRERGVGGELGACDSPVSSSMSLLEKFTENVEPSVRQEKKRLKRTEFQHLISVNTEGSKTWLCRGWSCSDLGWFRSFSVLLDAVSFCCSLAQSCSEYQQATITNRQQGNGLCLSMLIKHGFFINIYIL